MRPVELTTLTMGATVYRMNNSVDETIVVGANTFYAQAGLSRGDITDGRDPLTIKLPGDHAYPQARKLIPPSTKTTVLIQWLDRDDNPGSLRVLYKGWAKSTKLADDGQGAELYVESVIASFDRDVCEEDFSTQCHVDLFGAECGLSREDHKYEGTVASVAGNTIVVTGLFAGGRGAQWALPGTVKYGDDWRQVYQQDEDELTLSMPFAADVTGEIVTVYAGCDHAPDTCNDTFNNIVNYRGFPYIPTQNIFMRGLAS